MTIRRPEETIIRTRAELTELWRDLMGDDGFGIRTLWHLLLGSDGRLSPVILPIEDVPELPDPAMLGNLAAVLQQVCCDQELTSVAVLLSRPGGRAMTDRDRGWACAIRDGYGALSPWPVHLATRGEVQVFAPDDLIGAPPPVSGGAAG